MFKANNNTKILSLIGIFTVFAVTMVTGPIALSMGDNTAFAKSGHKDNDADQGIEQEQNSRQNSQCVSGESIVLSCNNLSAKAMANEGNNAAGQQGGDGEGGSGDADQGIEQEQSSDQDAQCVSGEDAIVSCNNAEFQALVNSGNQALAQD
jgi:hypothetical protein